MFGTSYHHLINLMYLCKWLVTCFRVNVPKPVDGAYLRYKSHVTKRLVLHPRFPSTVVAAIICGIIFSIEYSSEDELSEMRTVERLLQSIAR